MLHRIYAKMQRSKIEQAFEYILKLILYLWFSSFIGKRHTLHIHRIFLFDKFCIIECSSYSVWNYLYKQLLLLPHMIYKNQLSTVLCGINLGCSMQYDIFLIYTTFSFQCINYRHFETSCHLKIDRYKWYISNERK